MTAFAAGILLLAFAAPPEERFEWRASTPLPGSGEDIRAAACGDAFVVARGPDLFLLDPRSPVWRSMLPESGPARSIGAAPAHDGLFVAGGSEGPRFLARATRLRCEDGGLRWERLPDLPQRCRRPGVAVLGNTLYVAGGEAFAPGGGPEPLRTFWALDLSRERPSWEALEPWPGPPRAGPVFVAQDGSLLLAGGEPATADVFRYVPGKAWRRVSAAPRPIGHEPAVAYGPAHVLVLSTAVLAYHTVTDTWVKAGSLPESLHPATAAQAGGSILLVDRDGRAFQGVPVRRRGSLSALDYAVLGAYFLGMMVIGFLTSRGPRSTSRFFVAGGRIPWWAAGLSIFGTQLSAITFLAIPAKAYATDWVYVLVNLSVFALAPVIISFYLPFYCRLRVVSAYEYLEKRFNLAVRLFGTLSFTLFQLGRMSLQMYLPAIALSWVVGLDVPAAILLVGVVTTLYCMLGGAEAVVWTEVVQSVVLLGSALLSLGIMIAGVEGGLGGVVAIGRAHDKFHMLNWTWDPTAAAVWVVLGGSLLNNLIPYTADQAVVQRYMTTRDEQAAARSIWSNGVLTLVATALFFGLGTALFAFYRTHPSLLDPTLPTDGIFPSFMAQRLPSGLLGLTVAGLLSASMSGGINAIATALTTDIYRRFRAEAPDARCLRIAVGLTGVLGALATAIALVLAQFNLRSAWDAFLGILGLFGGSLAGLFALGIFTRRAHGVGALAGAAAGAAATWVVQSLTPVSFFLYGATGIVTCFGVGYLASLVLPARPRDLTGLTLHHTGGGVSSGVAGTDPIYDRTVRAARAEVSSRPRELP